MSDPASAGPGSEPFPGPEIWQQRGTDAFRQHLTAQAALAHARHAPLTFERLPQLLADPQCLRHPVRLVFEVGPMAPHQFAEPAPDPQEPAGPARVLYLRPALRDKPDWILLAVAYMIPVLNYGPLVNDDLALMYGASLLGFTEEDYYDRLCAMADACGLSPHGG